MDPQNNYGTGSQFKITFPKIKIPSMAGAGFISTKFMKLRAYAFDYDSATKIFTNTMELLRDFTIYNFFTATTNLPRPTPTILLNRVSEPTTFTYSFASLTAPIIRNSKHRLILETVSPDMIFEDP